jgi:acyl-CoA reductase-like NAD-dependent aldehyde dehydrogenase
MDVISIRSMNMNMTAIPVEIDPDTVSLPWEQPAATHREMDNIISRLRQGAQKFASISIEQRIALAESMQRGYLRVAEAMVRAGCEAKGIVPGTPLEAEEWATSPWGVVRQLRLIRDSLQAIHKHGNTRIGPVSRMADGNLAVRVFPHNTIDSLLFKDVTVDVHMQSGITPERLDAERAGFYKRPGHDGRLVLVLGAGNIGAIGVMDVITKMFNEGKVCLLKMNPVNAYLGPLIGEAFGEAISPGFLAVAYGGVMEGRHLVYHPGIDEIHLTGSDKTYDEIVWGPQGAGRSKRQRENAPLLKKPITSELGNISPVIVVPGPYTEAELRFQAEAVASAMAMNASFLCNSAKMLVMPKGWGHIFTQALHKACGGIEPRNAYYPDAQNRWRKLIAGRPMVRHRGNPGNGALPWTFISGLNADDDDEVLFRTEPFCSIISEVQVGSPDPVDFLEQAVDFANNRLWGTLCATLIVHPMSLRDRRIKAAVERAISRLQYGTVAINGFPGLSFVFASPPWGAYPGATQDNIQSGSGFVHNAGMLEGIEKVVIRCPLTAFPKPAYFPSHRTAHQVMRRMVQMEQNASWKNVPGIVLSAMLG